MKKPSEKILAALVCIIFVFLIFTAFMLTGGAAEKTSSLSAKSASLYEPTSETFIYTKDADRRLPMASTTKIMTALVALEKLDLDEEIAIPSEACGIEGSSLYLSPGEVLTASELLYGLMLRSANDAAVAIAYAVSGSVEGFSELMNEKAASLSLEDTHFTNPHGLDDKEHYTTAKELALITAEALKNETFKQIVSSKSTQITNSEGYARTVVNHNKLLRLYDGAIGVKTGYTKASGRSLVGAAERDGITLISVTINAPDDWNDHMKLFDMGFSSLDSFSLEKEQISYDIPVIGSDKEFIRVSNKDEFKAVYEIGTQTYKYELRLPRYTAAPIKSGDTLGYIVIYKNGSPLTSLRLTSDTDAPKTRK